MLTFNILLQIFNGQWIAYALNQKYWFPWFIKLLENVTKHVLHNVYHVQFDQHTVYYLLWPLFFPYTNLRKNKNHTFPFFNPQTTSMNVIQKLIVALCFLGNLVGGLYSRRDRRRRWDEMLYFLHLSPY